MAPCATGWPSGLSGTQGGRRVRRQRRVGLRSRQAAAGTMEPLEPRIALTATDGEDGVAFSAAAAAVRAEAANVPAAIVKVAAPRKGTYAAGAPLTFGVKFSRPVVVEGTPVLPVRIGETVRGLAFVGGSGTRQLTFSTTILPGEIDRNGVQIVGALGLPEGASIRDTAGTDATVGLPATPKEAKSVLVDGVAPRVTQIASPAAAGTRVEVRVRFDEPVVAKGRPALALLVNGWEREAPLSKVKNNLATFSYRLAGGESLAGVQSLGQILVPSGAALRDRAGNAAVTEASPPEGRLLTNVDRLGAGITTAVIFSLRLPAGVAPDRIQLFNADASGAATDEYLVDLFDDGSFVHRDTTAGDRDYTNTFAVSLPEPGVARYAAVVTAAGAVTTYGAELLVVEPPSAEVAGARDARAAVIQADLEGAIAGGMSSRQAFEQARAAIAAEPGVDPSSIVTTGAGIYWQAVDGTGMGILASSDRGSVKSWQSTVAAAPSSVVAAAETETDACGRALVLGAFFDQFEPNGGDESDDLARRLRDEGYEVDEFYNGSVTVAAMGDLGSYDVVIISSHGDLWARPGPFFTNNQTVILTREPVVPGQDPYRADIAAGRIQKISGYYAVTPLFFQAYAGQMDDTVVYVSACRSARSSAMGATFLGLGASVYMGYTDYVKTSFAVNRGTAAFEHLLADGTVGTIPGLVGDDGPEDDARRGLPDPARFRTFFRDASTKLDPECDLLEDYDLVLTYTWPVTQRDLDTGTQFLGESVGYAAGGSQYMTFSGDDTSAGGRETIVVDLHAAFEAGRWNDAVDVYARAGWYIPAGGSGPATVTVGLRRKADGLEKGSVQRSIGPGAQSGLATTIVGTARVTESGPEGREKVSFEFA